MGLDLDLAVSHPNSGFLPEYRHAFALRQETVRLALHDRGLSLPPERPLPERFVFRLSLGSYSTADTSLRACGDFVRHVIAHGTLPDLPLPPPTAQVPGVVRTLRGFEHHLAFGNGMFFVPVAFDPPFQVSTAEGPYTVASAVHARTCLDLVDRLATLDDDRLWELDELLPAAHDAVLAAEGTAVLPRWIDRLGCVDRLRDGAARSVEFGVCFGFS